MTTIDYDLNIFRQEVEVPDESLVDPSEDTVFEYRDPWYLDIIIHENGSQYHYNELLPNIELPIELTPEEAKVLDLGNGYFTDDDSWYGLEGFLKDYEYQISDRLWDIFNALPTTKEN
jgi:hypothetical protein